VKVSEALKVDEDRLKWKKKKVIKKQAQISTALMNEAK